uniref:Replication factor C subunit 3 n=1 Tax=Bartheletia paradoxa TaxID=669517 RepID=A0A2D0XI43_9BASI|nr:hypothetical protein SPAR03742 [Bartheletia paradoxa]
MSDVEMIDVDEGSSAPLPVIKTAKGKGKLVEDDVLNNNLPWVEKYRPQTLDEVVSHRDITSTIEKFIDKNRLPHLLLYGPPGTGKTSTILAMARGIYGKDSRNNVLELNASDDRGIDVVREQIKNFASTRVFGGSAFKLVILDEADMMTQAAQAALRRVIEQYTRHVRFCIICNYVNKIVPAIQSRCTKFRFSPLKLDQVEERLDTVIKSEGVNITIDGKAAVIKLSKGDMRRALNVLQACHAAYDVIDEASVYSCTGNPHPADIERFVQSMMNDEFTTSFNTITALKLDKGLALQDMITGIYDFVDSVMFSAQSRIYLLDHLATIEHRLSTGGSEKIQLSALLAAFKNAVALGNNK